MLKINQGLGEDFQRDLREMHPPLYDEGVLLRKLKWSIFS